MALRVFNFQYDNNKLYHTYVESIGVSRSSVDRIEKIPFLPISFFKTKEVKTTTFEPEIIFESSGTTGLETSRHFIKTAELYRKSFLKAFNLFYGDASHWCILALLPGYLERGNSSLVYMVDNLIKRTNNEGSGFYLNDLDKLYQALVHNEIVEKPTLLIGVTYALLDFAQNHQMKLKNTFVMETGGMKGKREEMTREEVHEILQSKLGLSIIHSEYGMTELLSQAYSNGNGKFRCPQWMQILIREYNDPFAVKSEPNDSKSLNGLINIIDLANLYSCSFIATDDVGRLYKNNSFEVLGRRDSSDLRGCSLLTV
ncbi:MAG: acyl transferase [Ginsengibacter sp.]